MKQAKIPFTLCAAFAVFALLGPSAVLAQTQTDMNSTASKNAAKADAAMTASYKRLMRTLAPAQKTQLVRAQRAWIAYRDAEATLLASGSEGGSMHPMVHAEAMKEMTQERTRNLEKDRRTLQEQ